MLMFIYMWQVLYCTNCPFTYSANWFSKVQVCFTGCIFRDSSSISGMQVLTLHQHDDTIGFS